MHLIHLRKGMSSEDTLRFGASINVPSFSVNATIPDESGVPLPWKAKVSSIGVGAAIPGVGVNFTATPAQVAAFIRKYILNPVMGAGSQSSAPGGVPQSAPIRFERDAERPIPYAAPWPGREPFESTISPWSSNYVGGRYAPSARRVSGARPDRPFSDGVPAIPYIKDRRATPGDPPDVAAAVVGDGSGVGGQMAPAGGLLGMIRDYLLTDAARSDSR
ncbi:hypothetical protein HL666_16150 [Bradyrhizobium sp. 83002]|uniref:hypothetical protein n=1 Tax=Bradyrhizobium aeschynomenes TaxID=2734909 RepID=UPI0015569FBA|nr:hypothetical protein [Bradyrhizobium aeschynomenes]NPU12306.1 hypothetical protein [Bradyrhizobium aeschynomenes]